MGNIEYTWTGFYSELADRLLPYKDDWQSLIAQLQKVYEAIGMKFPKLDADNVPVDIDPFTVFGFFNNGITDANRKKIIEDMVSAFGVSSNQPDDFAGIPVLNISMQRSTSSQMIRD